ncbi:MAG: ABC transporter ATP-binding protein, partial [Halocynthiibacter sp.]
MLSFFERLVDPYVTYDEVDTPPQKLWPFLAEFARPFRRVFWFAGIMAIVVAVVEIWLISYTGRIVDLLSDSSREDFMQTYGVELVGVALFILLVRPLLQALDVALLNNAILPNFGTMIRWRAHRHVLRQSVSWFENDFAGRIANRIMQTPPAAGEAIFQVFDAIAFSLAYIVGAAVLLVSADPRLVLPLLAWLVLYAALVRWTMRRVGPASKAASDARSQVTGRVVDSYTNIHSVKLFSHDDTEVAFAKEAIEYSRTTFQAEMRIYTWMSVTLDALNGLLIVGVVGWALALWLNGNASVGIVAVASALTLRLNAMTSWIMWALTSFFRSLGVVAEGMETIAQPITLVDVPQARSLDYQSGSIRLRGVSHHYGRDVGGLSEINLDIPAGQKVGLDGRSGAGKSTLVKLLLRLYDTDKGQILIDGQDISQVTQDSLRSQIGMVQQDSSLLHRTVRDNILYGRPGGTEAEVT